jgi:hypothetical protein
MIFKKFRQYLKIFSENGKPKGKKEKTSHTGYIKTPPLPTSHGRGDNLG